MEVQRAQGSHASILALRDVGLGNKLADSFKGKFETVGIMVGRSLGHGLWQDYSMYFHAVLTSYSPRFYFIKLSLSLFFSCQILLEYGRKGIVEPARQQINWVYDTFLLFKQFSWEYILIRCSIRYGLHYRTWPCIGTMTYTCLELAVKYDQMTFCCVCDWFLTMTGETLLEKEMATHPVFLLGESHGQRSLAGYRPWGCTESETTVQLTYNMYRESRSGRNKGKPWAHQHANVYSWFKLFYGRNPPSIVKQLSSS